MASWSMTSIPPRIFLSSKCSAEIIFFLHHLEGTPILKKVMSVYHDTYPMNNWDGGSPLKKNFGRQVSQVMGGLERRGGEIGGDPNYK